MTRRSPATKLQLAALTLVSCATQACGAGTPAHEDETKKLESKLSFVQAVACLSPATQRACDPALAASFESPPNAFPGDRQKGAIWCEDGRPRGRFTTASGEVSGEFGQVVWEAIWRVLKATSDCASAHGGAVSVTRGGAPKACKDPRFDMHALFDMARAMAKAGPPAAFREPTLSICEAEPTSCINPATMCPLFSGDPWNGVRRTKDGEPGDSPPGAPQGEPAPQDFAKARAERPSHGEMTSVLGPLIAEARPCLAPGAPYATVKLAFRSDGTVESVTVTFATPPAKACIEKVFKKALVRPFSAASYEIGVTVRARD